MIPLPTEVASLAPLAEALDAASAEDRLVWLNRLNRAEMVAVWKLAAGSTLDIAHFHGAEGEVIIHEGKNSLPLFNLFQKRFMLRDGAVQGYNHQSNAWFTGPGHFTMFAAGPEVVIDYLKVPATIPSEFPPLRDNMVGFSRFVYGGTQDWCRRISQKAIIGEARRGEKPIGAYFVLVRP